MGSSGLAATQLLAPALPWRGATLFPPRSLSEKRLGPSAGFLGAAHCGFWTVKVLSPDLFLWVVYKAQQLSQPPEPTNGSRSTFCSPVKPRPPKQELVPSHRARRCLATARAAGG